MSSYIYIISKVLLHHFIIFYFSNYRKHLYMLYFFHEIHPHKHSKNHRGRRTCNSLCSGSQAGLCSFGWNCCNSFGSADKKKKPCAQPLPAFLPLQWRKWISAMAMDSVLISHFLYQPE